MEKKDVINFAVGASMLAAAACGAKPDASSINNGNQNPTETPLTQTYTPQETAEEQDPLIPPVEELPKTCIGFGDYGTYCEEFNDYTGKNEITWHEDSMIKQGESNLVDLKIEGGEVEFEMPKDGVINSVAGEIEITTKDEKGNDVTEELTPGNPAVDTDENPLIPAGSTVSINYEPNNESNGLAIIFEEEKTFENLRLDWGEYGISKAVYDENKKAWIVALDDWCLIKKGPKTLEDLKIEGGQFEFVMPFDGYINNSAGKITREDEEELLLGNPVKDKEGNTLINAGERITIIYGEGNDSAGFQIEFPDR